MKITPNGTKFLEKSDVLTMLEKHRLFLAKCEGGEKADFTNTVIAGGTSLKGQDLSLALMDGAHFDACDFSGANLYGASVKGTIFRHCTFDGADLSRKKLSQVELDELVLLARKSKIKYLRLRGLDLRGLNFKKADLRKADFRECDLRGIEFKNKDLRYADFRGAIVQGTTFKKCDLFGINDYLVLLSDSRHGGIVYDNTNFAEDTRRGKMRARRERKAENRLLNSIMAPIDF